VKKAVKRTLKPLWPMVVGSTMMAFCVFASPVAKQGRHLDSEITPCISSSSKKGVVLVNFQKNTPPSPSQEGGGWKKRVGFRAKLPTKKNPPSRVNCKELASFLKGYYGME
jgi:hypothetical protein